MQQTEDGEVVHELEARVAERDQVLRIDGEQLTEDLTQLGQAVEAAVVTGVGALAVAVLVAGQGQQRIGEIELFGSGLAAGEIELEAQSGQLVVSLLQVRLGVT